MACIVVFGFSETSLTAVERGTSYLIEVGFIKGGSGAGVVRDVTLETVEITAGQHATRELVLLLSYSGH